MSNKIPHPPRRAKRPVAAGRVEMCGTFRCRRPATLQVLTIHVRTGAVGQYILCAVDAPFVIHHQDHVDHRPIAEGRYTPDEVAAYVDPGHQMAIL